MFKAGWAPMKSVVARSTSITQHTSCAFSLPVESKEAAMSARSGVPTRPLSRRIVLLHSARCAAGAAALLLPVKQAAAKMKQASVEYQDSPKGDQECSNCSLFQEPNACTLVDGEISPKGWCKFWVKKAG
jgi:hypothetical protein